MNNNMLIFFGVFFLVYGLANYYVGLRGKQAFRAWLASSGDRFYWPVFILAASSYFIGRFGERFLPEAVAWPFVYVGSYWLGALYYLVLVIAFIDLARLIGRWLPIVPGFMRSGPRVGLAVVALVIGVLTFGAWNACHPVWKTYDISVNKPAGQLDSLRVVLVTDIHLGKMIDAHRLEELVSDINSREPDVVLFAGDVVDEDILHFASQDMPSILRKIKSKYGVFASLGNHEYIGRETTAVIELIRSGRIVVLRDEYLTVGNHFVVAGRDDWDRARFTSKGRFPLADVLQGVDRKLPLIVMDHQPRAGDEAMRSGVDLLVSGHTHRGQLFPGHLITRALYENDGGLLRKGDMYWIVSAGFGTWGPPIRTSGPPEMVEINVRFEKTPK